MIKWTSFNNRRRKGRKIRDAPFLELREKTVKSSKKKYKETIPKSAFTSKTTVQIWPDLPQ